MSILAATKTDIPSKVHHTEYIVAENKPKESRAGIPRHLEQQLAAMRTVVTPNRLTSFMKAMVRRLHVKR